MPRDTSSTLPDAEGKPNGLPGSESGSMAASINGDDLNTQYDQGASEDAKAAASSTTTPGAEVIAGYGTRSRQRTGRDRPNYAEDKDIENDVYDFYHSAKEGDSGKRASRANGDATRAAAGTRKSSTTTDEAKNANTTTTTTTTTIRQNGSKDATGSAASSSPAPAPSQPFRKRKAAAAAAAATAQQSNGGTTVATRRNGNATQPSGAAGATTTMPFADRPMTNVLTWDESNALPRDGKLVADDGTVLAANDHVYLVSEPPGEPYYLGRIMEFLHKDKDPAKPVVEVRVNWFYRPKEVGRKSNDTRYLLATMHSDACPLGSIRGKCQIRHRVQIDDLEEYRRTPNCFWYEKLYDRYIQKNYDLIATSKIVNVPERVKKVLDERWTFVLVEQGRGKELTSAVKSCKRCSNYCASNDSVDCAVCQKTYHMNCVKPPLLKKPSRGFAWSCAACSRAQERKLEARHAPSANGSQVEAEDEEMVDEEDEDFHAVDTERNTPDNAEHHHKAPTPEQLYQASLWPYRYLGMHCKPEDALDYDDRIYPRSCTRVGPRSQAVVPPWTEEPAPYVPPEARKNGKNIDSEKGRKGRKKGNQDAPPVSYERGMDAEEVGGREATSTRLWDPEKCDNAKVQTYMDEAGKLYKELGLPELSTNLQDVALWSLAANDYQTKAAMEQVRTTARKDFKEPNPSPAELKKFEEAVSKYGGEWHLITKHVKSMHYGDVVRFYYTWKKTPRGKALRKELRGKKNKKEAKRDDAASKHAEDVADPDDDSAFEPTLAAEKKKLFRCPFCATTSSPRWRRAPNDGSSMLVNDKGAEITGKDKGPHYIVALCLRCAELWRRYAVRFEDLDEMAKKMGPAGKQWKRRQDEELLKELELSQRWSKTTTDSAVPTPDRAATPLNSAPATTVQEPPRKKLKGAAQDKDGDATQSDSGSGPVPKPVKKEKVVESVVIPEMPKPRILPCAVCDQMDLPDTHDTKSRLSVTCRECRLTVHRRCYGVMEQRGPGKWLCDMCTNDKNPQVSIHYKCVLCPIEHTEQELIEQPKLTHHKKKMSEKDRELEKIQVQQARKAAEQYRKKQEELNRPLVPREALKRTADNNWVHVTCAVWTPEIKFGNARAIEPSEGIPSIPKARYEEVCQGCNSTKGATAACQQCRMSFHIGCAKRFGHVLAFDITAVKSSRKDQAEVVSVNGAEGILAARLWCANHVPAKTTILKMNDAVAEGETSVLQLYVQKYKQADLTLTGTVRKANLMAAAAKQSGLPTQSLARRLTSTASTVPAVKAEGCNDVRMTGVQSNPVCISCATEYSPKWWPIDKAPNNELDNGHRGAIGSEAQKFAEQRSFQCHKCHKSKRTPKPPAVPLPPPPPARSLTPECRRPEMQQTARSDLPAHYGSALPSPERMDPRSVSRSWVSGPPGGGAAALTAHLPEARSEYPHGSPRQAAQNGSPLQGIQPRTAYGYPPHAAGPPATMSRDWSPRPVSQHGSQHGSPGSHYMSMNHVNGGPPPPSSGHGGSAAANALGSLRPAPGAILSSGPAHHALGPTPYPGGVPPSPHRRSSGSVQPSPYMGPYATGSSHVTPPPRNAPLSVPLGLSNGGAPPPPPPPPRVEGYPSALPPRGIFPATQGSPPMARSGPPSHEPHGAPPPSRAPEASRPSGASASPSLRNLLS